MTPTSVEAAGLSWRIWRSGPGVPHAPAGAPYAVPGAPPTPAGDRPAPPIVLLHGFAGTGESWRAVVAELGDRPTFAPDLPGHGASEPVVPRGPWTLADAAHALLAALPASFDLVGYSLGGRLALHLALAAPRRVRRLVLVGASAGLATESERASRWAADEVWAQQIETAGLAAFARAWSAQPLFASQANANPDALASQHARRLHQRPEGLAWAMRHFGLGRQADLAPALATLETPTLWLAGALDAKFAAIAERLAARMPAARAAQVAAAGHNLPLEAPLALARLIRDFTPLPALTPLATKEATP